MTSQHYKYILEFFDVSILIPVDADDLALLRINLNSNQTYLMQNGIEVILVFSGDIVEIMSLPDEFPFINWKIIIAKGERAKRMAARLNAGLQYASHRYILIMGPETVLVSDSIYELRHTLYHYPESFAVIPYHDSLEYRLLMAQRISLQTIGGYRELDDDRLNNVDIQRRLELAGQHKMMLTSSIAEVAATRTVIPSAVLFPRRTDVRDPDNAVESTIGFDWTHDKSPRAISLVLEKFEKVELKSPKVFQPEYGIVCLLQTHNEAAHLPGILSHLDGLCDGIILLDDGSSDGTYEKASSTQLLIKVQKLNKGIFDDLGNRNLLLQLAWLFRTEWFIFIDADERFDMRHAHLRQIAQMKDIDTVAFRLVHLWNTEAQYRIDIPEGNRGVFSRNRMFRNRGFLQIFSEREIHFCATPFKRNRYRSRILLLHYGLLDEAARVKKFNAYLSQDAGGKKQGYSYDFLLDMEIELGNVEELKLEEHSKKLSDC